jgi:hypothetical protein
MRTLILSRPTPVSPPPEMMPMLLQAFKGWRAKWRPKMEIFEFFVSGAGGWGVFNTTDEKELSQIMMEYPWQPFSANELIPTVDGDEALDRLIETMNRMMEAMKPG